MTEEDFERIQEIVRKEIGAFMREFFEQYARRPYDEPRPPSFEREVEFLSMLNRRYIAALDAGPLMKGCKYDKAKIDDIAAEVTKIGNP